MTTVRYGDKTPKTGVGRLLAMGWMFSSILPTPMFTATIIAKLTVNTMDPSVGIPADLDSRRIGAVRLASGAGFLADAGMSFAYYPTLNDALAALSNKEIERVVDSYGSLSYAVGIDYSDALHVSPDMLTKTHIAFALPEASPLKEPLDIALMQATQNERSR